MRQNWELPVRIVGKRRNQCKITRNGQASGAYINYVIPPPTDLGYRVRKTSRQTFKDLSSRQDIG